MKRLLLFLNVILFTGVILAQTPDKSRKDLWIYKATPAIFLQGSGALINFNDGDLILTQSTNALTLSGGNLALGTNSLTMSGSIGVTGTRVTKGWFTNLEITNLPTINGASLSALYTSGDIAIGANNITGTGSIGATGAGKLTKIWSVNAEFTNLPTISGVAIHTAPAFTTSITVDAAGDTTVTAAKGKIVYKSSDNHFYGCISTTNVNTPKWKRLDN